jgi:hypothetical protein
VADGGTGVTDGLGIEVGEMSEAGVARTVAAGTAELREELGALNRRPERP